MNLSFNDYISTDFNDLHTKNADYYAGGVSTVISNTMNLLFLTFKMYLDTFPVAESKIDVLWSELFKEYGRIYKGHFFDE